MQKRIRVRREHPSVLSWALALMVTMLAVWLITLSAPAQVPAKETAAGERVTEEITLAAAEAYFVDMGCYSDGLRARVAASLCAARGAAGYMFEDAEGFHVLGAGYEHLSDAQRIADQLNEREGMEATVLHLRGEAVSMRVTAPAAAVEAIVQADSVLRGQLSQAAAMALQTDRGEIPPPTARMLAAVSESELRAAAQALAETSGAAENPVCAGQIALLNRAAAAFAEASETVSAASLSGRLRCCHAAGTAELIAWMQGLYG